MSKNSSDEIVFEVVEDFGSFGDRNWMFHLTKTSFNGGEARYDLRPWNEDMTAMGKGVRFKDKSELFDLLNIIEDALQMN